MHRSFAEEYNRPRLLASGTLFPKSVVVHSVLLHAHSYPKQVARTRAEL
jgi:hypothetical protein